MDENLLPTSTPERSSKEERERLFSLDKENRFFYILDYVGYYHFLSIFDGDFYSCRRHY